MTTDEINKEAAELFYDLLPRLPNEVKVKLSCHDLRSIFRIMVIPVIDRARALDRGASPRELTEIEALCAKILSEDERGNSPGDDILQRLSQLIGPEPLRKSAV